jgi:hypothetical protein
MPKYTVEACGQNNEQWIYAPLREKLRGHWSWAKVGHKDKSEYAKVLSQAAPEVPGQCILIDTDKKELVVFDPLIETPEGQRVLAAMNGVNERFGAESGGKKTGAERSILKLRDENEVKTHLHFMRLGIDEGLAKTPNGGESLPSLEEIAAMPGKRLRDPGNSGPQGSELVKWVDEVPVGRKPIAGNKE